MEKGHNDEERAIVLARKPYPKARPSFPTVYYSRPVNTRSKAYNMTADTCKG